MKTHVISLENADDYISICDKLLWAKSPRILLVWPDESRLRLLLSDMVLIVRKAEEIGSQVAIVCDDQRVLDLAAQINLSVFSSIPEAQKKAWRRPKKTRKLLQRGLKQKKDVYQIQILDKQRKDLERKIHPILRIIIFLFAIIAVGGLITLFIPSAEVHLSPNVTEESLFVPVWTNPEVKMVSFSGAIPTRSIPVVVDGMLIRPSTGIEKLPTQSAKGDVIFRNLTDGEIFIPSGTIVRTTQGEIIRFSTSKSVTLSAGVNQEIAVPVVALVSGVSGNINPGLIDAVESEIGGSVAVTNEMAISGGVDTKTTAPSELDYQKANNELLNELQTKALAIFQEEYGDEIFWVSEDNIILDEILLETKNPEVGIPADQFQLNIEARFLISYISKVDVETIIKGTFETNLIPGYEVQPGSLYFAQDGSVEEDQSGNLRLGVLATQKFIERIDENQIKQSIVGDSLTKAQEKLSSSFDQVRISINPGIFKHLPFFTFRIKVIIDEN